MNNTDWIKQEINKIATSNQQTEIKDHLKIKNSHTYGVPKKHLLAKLQTYGSAKQRVRYFQLLSYISLTGNILLILTIFYLLRRF